MNRQRSARNRRRRPLHFTKMHGLGNDFVVLDLITQNRAVTPELVKRLADRRFGIGCDQVLLVEPPTRPDVDFRYRIFNADGGEVYQCGNGARCFARFVRDHKLTGKDHLVVETGAGVIELALKKGLVEVDMGVPRLEPAEIPIEAQSRQITYTLEIGAQAVELSAVSMGNPHAVIVVDDVDTAPVAELGQALQCDPRFPEQVNVGFMQVVDRRHIRLRVYERGAGETLACGSGACAAVVAGRLRGLLDDSVVAALRGGELHIRWAGVGEPVVMSGPATSVYEGQILL